MGEGDALSTTYGADKARAERATRVQLYMQNAHATTRETSSAATTGLGTVRGEKEMVATDNTSLAGSRGAVSALSRRAT